MRNRPIHRGLSRARLWPVVLCLATVLGAATAGAFPVTPSPPPDPEAWWVLEGTVPADRLGEQPAALLRMSAGPVERKSTLDFANRRMDIVWASGKIELFRWARPLDQYVKASAAQKVQQEWVKQLRGALVRREGEAEAATGMSFDIPVNFPRQVEAIIGQGANLDVTGSETISFRGESSYRVDEKETEFGRRSKFPQLDMKQRLRVNLDGTIGEKVHVLVNHDSEVQSALENRIKLRYEGREDEIIQKIEMGNTDLSITGAEFVSYRGTHQGLFGAKALAQVGALDVSVIASKQEGKSARSTFVGKASKDSVTIYDIEYQKRKYYTLRMSADPHRLTFPQGTRNIPERVTIWVDDHDVTNDADEGARPGSAYLSNPDEESLDRSRSTFGFYTQMTETEDYYIDPGSGMVTFYQPLPPECTVAVSYVDSVGTQMGNAPAPMAGAEPDWPDTLELKMLKPRKDLIRTEDWAYTRGYEFKNFYYLDSRNILADDFDLEIRRIRTGSESIDPDKQDSGFFIEVLGLDKRDNLTGAATPDGRIDPEWVDYTLGVLQFPDLRPFDPNAELYPLEQKNANPYNLYEETLFLRRQDYQKYYLVAKYRTPQTSYTLNQANILEGSEKVILNGRQLQRGTDYSIVYEIGRVDLMGQAAEEAQSPDANISIDFEYAPFLSLAQQSLVGASGTYTFSERNNLGFAWLYESKSTPEDRPRLGQEPSRYQVGDINGRFEFNPSFMTRMVDALPLVRAELPSSLKLSGEVAASFPNPNTKDEVYIDDMEGTEDSRVLATSRRSWVPASLPQSVTAPPIAFNWYNPRNRVKAEDVYPNLSEQEGDESLTILELDASWAQIDTAQNWIGLMRLLSKSGMDLSESKFFQIVYNDGGDSQGKMHVDLGTINEDFYHPGGGVLDSEDKNSDGILDAEEDTGLDGVSDEDATPAHPDDGNDNYQFDYSNSDAPDAYRYIDGTENNDLLDTEDLDRDGSLGTGADSYFSKTIDLASLNPEYLSGDSLNGNWKVLQIPLSDMVDEKVREPMWESIRYARIWFEDLAWWNRLQILSVEVIGNRWLERGVRSVDSGDSVQVSPGEYFTLKTVNNKENPEYDPPFEPGEERGSVGKREQKEQSLAFVYDNLDTLDGGHFVSARKQIHAVAGSPELNDYTRYRALDFWVKGYRMEPGTAPPVFFVRLATDRQSFYEYRVRLGPGWQQKRIDLEQMPRLKLEAADTTVVYDGLEMTVRDPSWPDLIPAGGEEAYAVYGQPTLTKVVEITAGVMNDTGQPVTGEVWYNEIRLREIKKDVGLARRVTASVQFSDFLTVSGDMRLEDGEFASLGTQRSGRDQSSYSLEGKAELGKFVEPLGLKAPATASFRRSEDRPQLVTGSDVILDAKGSVNERTDSDGSSLGLSLSKSRTSGNPLLHLLFDGWAVSANRTDQKSSSPIRREYSETVSANASYRLNTQRPGLKVFREVELAYLPKALRFSVDGRRQTSRSWDVFDDRTREELRYDRVVRTATGTGEVNVSPLSSKSLSSDYSFLVTRDLLPDKTVGFRDGLGFGRENQRTQRTNLSYKPTGLPFVGFLSPTLAYDTQYDEDQSPNIRQAGDPEGTRKASATSTLRWTFNLKMQELRGLFEPGPKGKGAKNPQKTGKEPAAPRGKTPAGQAPSGRPPAGPPPKAETGEEAPPSPESGEKPPPSPEPRGNAPPVKPGPGEETPPAEPPPEGEKKEAGPALWSYPFTVIMTRVEQLNATYTVSRNSAYERLPDRPSLGYQFGMASGVAADLAARSLSKGRDTRGEKKTMAVQGSVTPLFDIAVSTKYSSSNDTRWVAAGARQTRTRTWPDMSWSYDGIERFGFIKKYVTRAGIQSGFVRTEDASGPIGRDERTSTRTEWSPLLSINATVKGGVSSTLSIGRATEDSDEKIGGVRSRSTKGDYQLSLKYSFSLPEGVGMPLRKLGGGGGGESGKVSLNLDMSYSRDKSENLTSGSVTSQNTRLSIVPKATYTFSRNMNGNLNAKFAQDSDVKRGRTTRMIGLGVELTIKF